MSLTTSSLNSSSSTLSNSLTSSSPYSSSSSSIQMGGKGYRHKKNCKCRLCKKGGNNTNDIEMGKDTDLELGPSPIPEEQSSDTYDKM